jgi:octaprenyl-diphosphate synthase
MLLNEILKIVKSDLEKVEAELEKNLRSKIPLIPQVGKHVLRSGGKRFRPLLLLLSAKLCGYSGQHHILLAGVLEFIHTAALFHDDVVDHAKLRRGSLSANSLWGNEASILVGDFLLSRAFSLMVMNGDPKILKILSMTSIRMTEGEAFELMQSGNLNISEDNYISMIGDKTATLISTACRLGAIFGKVGLKKEESLTNFGWNLGIAFQLMDDTLDYTSKEAEFGKSIGKDLEEQKITLPLIYTLKGSSPEDRQKIARIIESDTCEEKDLATVVNLIRKYRGIDYTLEKAKEYVAKAKGFLNVFEDSKEKAALMSVADYVIERKW